MTTRPLRLGLQACSYYNALHICRGFGSLSRCRVPSRALSTSAPSSSDSSKSPEPVVRTAGALMIGDEILNGKTLDRNSHYFARWCFEHGIELKRIEVIPDLEEDIIERSREMTSKYDLVVTSGGIGSTHDDITYASLAKAFKQELSYHNETIRRMEEIYKHRSWTKSQTEPQREAMLRMALFPAEAEVIFVQEDLWVPVVRLERKLCVLPGIPGLFQRLVNKLGLIFPFPPEIDRPHRLQIFTTSPESTIAPYLADLQRRLSQYNIQVGSYPVLGQGVFVSLIGKKSNLVANHPQGRDTSDVITLLDVAREVEEHLGGRALEDDEVAEIKREGQLNSLKSASGSMFNARPDKVDKGL